MLQPIDTESTFATSLEAFLRKADNYLTVYYNGQSDKSDVQAMVREIKNLAADVDTKQLEAAFQLHCDKEIMTSDYYDSNWS